MNKRPPVPNARRARAALAVAAACLLLAGCGSPPPDPGAQRSDATAKDLRDRLIHTQGRT